MKGIRPLDYVDKVFELDRVQAKCARRTIQSTREYNHNNTTCAQHPKRSKR